MFSFIKRKINNWIVKRRETKRREAEVKKQSVIYHLERCWTPLEIHDRNVRMIVNSAGWLGGNWTENDFKRSMLMNNRSLFTIEELNRYLTRFGG